MVQVGNLSVFRVQQAASPFLSRAQLRLPASWLHGTVFAPRLGHVEDKVDHTRFFSKIMSEIRTPLAEDQDPHQVHMEEIMSETKDKWLALFQVWEFSLMWRSCWGWR